MQRHQTTASTAHRTSSPAASDLLTSDPPDPLDELLIPTPEQHLLLLHNRQQQDLFLHRLNKIEKLVRLVVAFERQRDAYLSRLLKVEDLLRKGEEERGLGNREKKEKQVLRKLKEILYSMS